MAIGMKFTESLRHYLWEHDRERFAMVCILGKVELLDEIWDEYIAWCKTDEGMSYLKGGANYKEAS